MARTTNLSGYCSCCGNDTGDQCCLPCGIPLVMCLTLNGLVIHYGQSNQTVVVGDTSATFRGPTFVDLFSFVTRVSAWSAPFGVGPSDSLQCVRHLDNPQAPLDLYYLATGPFGFDGSITEVRLRANALTCGKGGDFGITFPAQTTGTLTTFTITSGSVAAGACGGALNLDCDTVGAGLFGRVFAVDWCDDDQCIARLVFALIKINATTWSAAGGNFNPAGFCNATGTATFTCGGGAPTLTINVLASDLGPFTITTTQAVGFVNEGGVRSIFLLMTVNGGPRAGKQLVAEVGW